MGLGCGCVGARAGATPSKTSLEKCTRGKVAGKVLFILEIKGWSSCSNVDWCAFWRPDWSNPEALGLQLGVLLGVRFGWGPARG